MTNMNFTKPRSNQKLTPWQVTGITDGEGSYTYFITKTGLTKFKISIEFKVTQKAHSEGVLYELKDYFGCGKSTIEIVKILINLKFHQPGPCWISIKLQPWPSPAGYKIRII